MLRLNRGRITGLALTGFIVYFLFLSSTNSNSDFRKRTEEGLSRRHGILQGDISDEAYRAQTNAQLNEVLSRQNNQQEKPLRASDEGAGRPKDSGEEVGVAGRKTMVQTKDKDVPKYPKEGSGAAAAQKQKGLNRGEDDESEAESKKVVVVADPARDIAREKLQEYLKKPIVIFSKSHCPHSKAAKQLLLSVYKITPTPLVVELDKLTDRLPAPPSPQQPQPHEPHAAAPESPPASQGPTLGQKIQEILGEIRGRKTVPNIVVGGTKSIGGNDLVWEMHEEGSLKETILALGGKRIVAVEEVGLSDSDSDSDESGKRHGDVR